MRASIALGVAIGGGLSGGWVYNGSSPHQIPYGSIGLFVLGLVFYLWLTRPRHRCTICGLPRILRGDHTSCIELRLETLRRAMRDPEAAEALAELDRTQEWIARRIDEETR